MRVASRLQFLATATITSLVLLAAVLYWSLGEFRAAERAHDLSDQLKANLLESSALRDQYFLYGEPRLREQWEANKQLSDALIVQAQDLFQEAEAVAGTAQLQNNVEGSAAIFRRIAGNRQRLTGEISPAERELERRLSAQLLLRSAMAYDSASSLQEVSDQRLGWAYRHLISVLALFGGAVALATISGTLCLRRLIRKRLLPLHQGAKIVADGDLTYRIGASGADEFAELASSINTMTARLESRTRQLDQEVGERRAAEARALAAQAEAERANRAKSRFLAAASHDLRQPLAALSLYVGLLKHRVSGEGGKLAANIEDCVDSLSELLGSLLDVSKLDAGVVIPRPSDFGIDEALANLRAFHSSEAQLKGLSLRIRKCGAVVRTDKQLLQRTVGNFIANAVRYTDSGGVLIACRHREGKLWVEVWDTGVGIAEDDLALVFEEFRQLGDDARSRGSGLGLAIAAKTAALLGLRIRVKSRPGRGSLFALELPAGDGPAGEQAAAPPPAARALRIGLVEDNPMVLAALNEVLRAAGHEVVAAASGSALLAGFGPQVPDLLICDFRLAAGETGFDVITAARSAYGTALPAILVTGDTDPGLLRSMSDRGIVVLFKPLQVDALLAALARVTERRADDGRALARDAAAVSSSAHDEQALAPLSDRMR